MFDFLDEDSAELFALMIKALLPRIPTGDAGIPASPNVVRSIAQRRFREQPQVRQLVELRKSKQVVTIVQPVERILRFARLRADRSGLDASEETSCSDNARPSRNPPGLQEPRNIP